MTQSQFIIREMEHIHNKAIFDACNEALNIFRPFYISNTISNIISEWRPLSLGSIESNRIR